MDARYRVEPKRVDPNLHHHRYANGERELHHADTIAKDPEGDRRNIMPTVTTKNARLWPSTSAGTGDDAHNHASDSHGAATRSQGHLQGQGASGEHLGKCRQPKVMAKSRSLQSGICVRLGKLPKAKLVASIVDGREVTAHDRKDFPQLQLRRTRSAI